MYGFSAVKSIFVLVTETLSVVLENDAADITSYRPVFFSFFFFFFFGISTILSRNF